MSKCGKCSAAPGCLEFAEMTLLESTSYGLAHHQDMFTCVHYRPPELAQLEEAWSRHLGSPVSTRYVCHRKVIQHLQSVEGLEDSHTVSFMASLISFNDFTRLTSLCRARCCSVSSRCGWRKPWMSKTSAPNGLHLRWPWTFKSKTLQQQIFANFLHKFHPDIIVVLRAAPIISSTQCSTSMPAMTCRVPRKIQKGGSSAERL